MLHLIVRCLLVLEATRRHKLIAYMTREGNFTAFPMNGARNLKIISAVAIKLNMVAESFVVRFLDLRMKGIKREKLTSANTAKDMPSMRLT